MNAYQKAFYNLDHWIDQNPQTYDLLDIKNLNFYHKILKFSQVSKITKILTAPLILIAERQAPVLRKIFKIQKADYAQGQALLARAYLKYYQVKTDENYLNKAIVKLNWLIANRSDKTQYYGWGQPYNWYARETIVAHTPRATVSTQVAHAFLDAYEITQNKSYLDIAISTCELFLNEFNWDEDADKDICFSYTTQDYYHIHNANMLVSATLIRTWHFTKINRFKDFGLRAMKFTLKHQNQDGSWYYWSLPDKIIGKIDNYHTGFVLEALELNRRYLKGEFVAFDAFEKGIEYFIANLFTKDFLPKLTNKSLYPIDIQSCAQSILTFTELSEYKSEYLAYAKKIANWTNTHMRDSTGFYYYRMFKNGKIDKTPYIRWSEAWMLRALIFLYKTE